MNKNIRIELVKDEKIIPYHLLLLADPDREKVQEYLQESECYMATQDKEIIGVMVIANIGENTLEIKNIAVAPNYQQQGIGKLLLAEATVIAQHKGVKFLQIGTGNSSIAQLALYQKQGFEMKEIISHFFTHNYPKPIYENGIQCKHMVVLEKRIK